MPSRKRSPLWVSPFTVAIAYRMIHDDSYGINLEDMREVAQALLDGLEEDEAPLLTPPVNPDNNPMWLWQNDTRLGYWGYKREGGEVVREERRKDRRNPESTGRRKSNHGRREDDHALVLDRKMGRREELIKLPRRTTHRRKGDA